MLAFVVSEIISIDRLKRSQLLWRERAAIVGADGKVARRAGGLEREDLSASRPRAAQQGCCSGEH